MAQLFIKQAKIYAEARPNYPQQLFDFISSFTPIKDVAWDVGTGNGQAAQSLAGIYKNVIATDTSLKQLQFASKLPNIRYQQTPPVIPMDKLEEYVSKESSVDLVTVAQALHWFDLPEFYKQVKWVLKKPHGVIAAWCYTVPQVNEAVDSVFEPFYKIDSEPYWDDARKWVDDRYEHIDFPFEDQQKSNNYFEIEREMSLDEFLTYLRSWSAYQTAKEKGVDLLTHQVVDKFRLVWNQDAQSIKLVKFPLHLRIGKVVEESDVVVFSVKPQVVKDVVLELQPLLTRKKLLVSIAAGIKLKDLQEWAGRNRFIRVNAKYPICCRRSSISNELGWRSD